MAKLVELAGQYEVAFGNDPDSDRHGIVVPSVGSAEPQPLPGGRHPLPVRQPPGLAGRGGGRQDAGLQRAHRPGGGDAGTEAGRGAGRLQVVRARAARRVAGLRRRGERRRQLPPPGRHASGPPTRTASCSPCWRPRSPPAPARIPASTTGRSSPPAASPATPGIDAAGHPAGEGAAEEAVARRRQRQDRWPASRSPPCSPGRRATAPPIGGLKVTADNGWFAARPSGTENIYKIYAESFRGRSTSIA